MKRGMLSIADSTVSRSSRRGVFGVPVVGVAIFLLCVTSHLANAQGNVRPAMIGDGADSVAAHLHYPPKAKAARDETAIPFYCEVAENGKASFISLFGPEDKKQFRVALLKALSEGRFQPAISGGKPVAVLLGGTAFFLFRGNQPIIAISLSTADKEKTAALGNYIQPQMLISSANFRRKLRDASHDKDVHFRPGLQPVYPRAAVTAQIDAQGNLLNTKIIAEYPPDAGFGPVLVKAFQGTKFIPAYTDGKPVAGQFDMIANYDKMQNPDADVDLITGTHIKRDVTNW